MYIFFTVHFRNYFLYWLVAKCSTLFIPRDVRLTQKQLILKTNKIILKFPLRMSLPSFGHREDVKRCIFSVQPELERGIWPDLDTKLCLQSLFCTGNLAFSIWTDNLDTQCRVGGQKHISWYDWNWTIMILGLFKSMNHLMHICGTN